ncbi:MAG: putative Ig domain-containing protein [Bdellovibrionales bacterium]|nr:putative Ig domain-containing protein [Bdellovibrionales bacterium]
MKGLFLLWVGLCCVGAAADEAVDDLAQRLRKWEAEQAKALVENYKTSDVPLGSLAAIDTYEKDVDDWLREELGYLDKAKEVPVSVNAARAYVYAEATKRKQAIPKWQKARNDAFNRYYSRVQQTWATNLERMNRDLRAALKQERRYGSSYAYRAPALPPGLSFTDEKGYQSFPTEMEEYWVVEQKRREHAYTSLALLLPQSAPAPVDIGPVPVEKKNDPKPAAPAPPVEPVTQTVSGSQDGEPVIEVDEKKPAPAPPEELVEPEPEEFEWAKYKGKPVQIELSWNGNPIRDTRTLNFLSDRVNRVLVGEDVREFKYSNTGNIYYQDGLVGLKFFIVEVEKKTERVIDREAPLVPKGKGVFEYQYKEQVVESKVSRELDDFGKTLYAYKVKEQVTTRWHARVMAQHREKIAQLAKFIEPYRGARPPRPSISEGATEQAELQFDSGLPFAMVDWHGRDLIKNGFSIVDWEGHIANPAFKVFIRPKEGVRLPLDVTIKASESRLYFSNPSSVGKSGPRKTISLGTADEWESFYVSIWPDRDGKNEEHELTIEYNLDGEKSARVKLFVLDQDKDAAWQDSPVVSPTKNLAYLRQPTEKPFLQRGFPFINGEPLSVKDPWPFTITLDYTLDKSGYFRDDSEVNSSVDDVVQLAVNDWAYFVDEMPYKDLPPGTEVTEIQRHASDKSAKFEHTNRYTVKDFVLYFVGADTLNRPHAQAGARGATLETVGSNADKLCRTGQVLVEGIHAQVGISLNAKPSDWWQFTHSEREPGELYSYLIHEVGHPLFAYPTYPNWALWSPENGLKSERLLDLNVADYAGEMLFVDQGDHLPDAIDRASRKQAFGAVEGRSPKAGLMPQRRWIVTKLDLLLMQAVGYKLKRTSAFEPLKLETKELAEASVGKAYRDGMRVSGGIPYYYWDIAAGSLPAGMQLDSYTGVIHGTPQRSGTYNFILRVYDYDNADGIGLAHATQLVVN